MANLPQPSLSAPNPATTVTRIDFEKADLPEYASLYAVLLDNVLTAEECQTLLQAAEAEGSGEWERAMINAGNNRQVRYDDVRKCGRIIWDSHDVVARLWDRVRDHVPEIHRLENQPRITGAVKRGNGAWNLTRLNERMRFLKYQSGEYFKVHQDGKYVTPDSRETSHMTLHLYLNDAAPDEGQLPEMAPEERLKASGCELHGGATTFLSEDLRRRFDVMPKAGRVLIFQHNGLWHSGDDVVQGVKYTMRTDIMYAVEDS